MYNYYDSQAMQIFWIAIGAIFISFFLALFLIERSKKIK